MGSHTPRLMSEILWRQLAVTEFAKYFGKSPDKLGPNELRTYQAYLLTECKLTPGTVVNRVAALRFFFVTTLKRHQFREFLPYPQDRRRLPTVLSREEVARLIDAAGTLFRRRVCGLCAGPRLLKKAAVILPVSSVNVTCPEGVGGLWNWLGVLPYYNDSSVTAPPAAALHLVEIAIGRFQ